jgi:hypothetical protein
MDTSTSWETVRYRKPVAKARAPDGGALDSVGTERSNEENLFMLKTLDERGIESPAFRSQVPVADGCPEDSPPGLFTIGSTHTTIAVPSAAYVRGSLPRVVRRVREHIEQRISVKALTKLATLSSTTSSARSTSLWECPPKRLLICPGVERTMQLLSETDCPFRRSRWLSALPTKAIAPDVFVRTSAYQHTTIAGRYLRTF